MGAIHDIEKAFLRTDLPAIHPGDSLLVKVKIKEGDKERLQPFEGTVIKLRGCGIKGTFTVRKISYGIGVERIFPLHSPSIESIKVLSQSVVRKSKLYYLRGLKGKAARLKTKR
ncbi:MAG: 50S ribosomal protein L19 [Deltaproteobacteria bacterium RIFCSPLOWO2_02_FULL_53_8]|nr:MAG: 50S ribosomal protein L19 [Deltaproteobacteria bacterium RIFCSPLOWO2_02_FULL_53_8]